MSIQAVGWALDQDLPARPKLVLVSIANHADKTDGYCWLRASTIAQEAACKERSVYRYIAALVRNGFLRKEKRRGDDGKQRSNDYWILFNRDQTEWDWGGIDAEDSGDEAESEMHGSDEDDIQHIDGGMSQESPGQSDSDDSRQTEKMPQESVGPRDSGVSHNRIAEPSKTNPEKARVPRGYKPPPATPPQPMGSTTREGSGDLIFVFFPSRAYDAWKRCKERELKRPWKMLTSRNGRSGWYFPSLFPPEYHPPPSELMTEDDVREFTKIA